ncbi:endogenous retrovirus group PABLB member 1 Env polyprotein [Choloepus didactylus]|uniref:endogenous retrovirus group PABLB member 1 Env polyprotein n=1 Tax=Choloepus didactylus TaxID=27675 RepID=UPI0018A07D36|nr:endogenous retrovirus group PABLB member 1 Env polyprotein [Choloepus didactylus]
MGDKLKQITRAWTVCQIFGCYLIGTVGNTFLQWAAAVTSAHNRSQCWVCTELPSSSATGLPWTVSPANKTTWDAMLMWQDTHQRQVWKDFFPFSASPNIFPSKTESYSYIYSLVREQINKPRPLLGYSVEDGFGWLTAEAVTINKVAPVCMERTEGYKEMGWLPLEHCGMTIHLQKNSYFQWQNVNISHGAYPSPKGWLWTCGRNGWPYLPYDWIGRCTWGQPYVPATLYDTLPHAPSNWEMVKTRYRIKRTAWWFYPLAVLAPGGAAIVAETHIAALANHTAKALNESKLAISLLNDETTQLRKVVLQNRMALDILTAAQGGTCALINIQCCVYVPDNSKNVTQALNHMQDHIQNIEHLSNDPLSNWFNSLIWPWRQLLIGLLCICTGLLVFCCSLYCCCGLWMQFLSSSQCKLLRGGGVWKPRA